MITDLPLTVRYALAACVCMARRYHGGRVSSKTLAEETGIPAAFLSKVLRQLGRAELIQGERGHHGGYHLARPPAEILIADVLGAVADRDEHAHRVCAMGDRNCSEKDACPLHDLWSVATAPLSRLAETVTLDRLIRMDPGGKAGS